MVRKLGKFLTNRIVIFLLLTAIELAIFTLIIYYINTGSPYFYILFAALSISCLFEVLGRNTYPEYKIAWILVITCIPGLGFIFYIFLGRKIVSKKKKQIYLSSNKKLHSYLKQEESTLLEIKDDLLLNKCAKTIKEVSDFPIYKLNDINYFATGEDFFAELKKHLQTAKKFIFMEYFIIEKGKMWNEILDILTAKAKSGIEIRVIYDDFGSLLNLPGNYPKKLSKLGIKAMRFNRIVPLLDARANIRNHRKITVIDGEIAFVGGANLADEYINAVEYYGYWKDCAVSFTGPAVNSFTISILQTWTSDNKFEDPTKYLNNLSDNSKSSGFILPFQDSPLLKLNICESLFLQLIYSAKKNINISSPYLVLNSELKTALIGAAKSGVDVNIIIPHKPDKKFVFALTKAFATELNKYGIKIYEYTPGFNHQKSFTIDNKYSIISTANLDLRSLYTNYECGVLVKDNKFTDSICSDFNEMLKKSKQVIYKTPNIFVRTYRSILRIFAPLM